MASSMSSLLEEVSHSHFPYPPAAVEESKAFEQRVGWTLAPDLRAFYLHCNGAELIKRLPNTLYRMLPLSKIVRAREAIFGKRNDDDAHGPAAMWAICDVQDGNYVLVDVSRQEDGRYPLMDGYHEAWPDPKYCGRIANSFSEFLEQVLRTRRGLYWLGE